MGKIFLQQKIKNLPKGWRKVKLGEYIELIRGVSYRSSDLKKEKESIYLVNLKNIDRGGGFRMDGLKEYLGDYKEEQIVQKGDIVIALTDLTPGAEIVGMPALIPKLDKPACISMDLVKVKIKNDGLDKKYLYYLLNTSRYKGWIIGFASGVNVLHLKTKGILDFEIYIPQDINEQKRIADILSAFDEKIELNNRINQILEEMAQAIFKEWFVKFRFPGWQKVKFVDSELGKIPEGWRVGDLYELIEFEGGSQPPKEEHIYEKRPGYIRFIQNRDYTSDAHITYIEESKRNKICDEYDIMMDKYGEAGKVRFGLTGAYNVALAKITPKPPLMREYLRWFLKQLEIQQLIEGSAVASTRSSVNKLVFKNLKILLPPKRLMEKFEEIGRLYIENYLKIKAENQKLSALRDLLLPKLMSGEVKV